MARNPMTVRVRPGPYAIVPTDVAAFDVFDFANGMTLPANGAIGLIFQNATAGALTVTIHSQPDQLGRSGDITAYSIGAGHFAIFQEFPGAGWTSGGLMNIDASGALGYLAIQRAPGT